MGESRVLALLVDPDLWRTVTFVGLEDDAVRRAAYGTRQRQRLASR